MNPPAKTKDVFPSLDEAFARRVQGDLRKRFPDTAPTIAWEDWCALKPYLARYKESAEYVRGFLNKGQAKLLRDISKRARALRDAITRARDADLGVVVALPFETVPLSDFEDLLLRIELKFVLDGKIAPDWEDTTRVDLYRDFDWWWRNFIKLPSEIEEGSQGTPHPTPFMFVANEVFNLPDMPPPTGSSYKSLKDLRRKNKDRWAGVEKLAESVKKSGRLE